MGSASSKLKKKLARGDETAALVILDSKDLQRKFNPNASYGDRHNHDTPLHMAARHAMQRALRWFLFDYGGNPNKKNGNNETSLHCACQLKNDCTAASLSAHEECVNMLVDWKGAHLGDGCYEKLDVAAQDKFGNTALHYAAQTGFISCVKLLVDLDAPLFSENDNKLTPCELAEKASMIEIAQYLESKMVFCENDEAEPSMTSEAPTVIQEEYYQGLRPQELQEAKDTLIVETSDMLRVPLFTAEVLLRHHEWDKEVLLEAWIANPVSCCEASGVVPPSNLDDVSSVDHELSIMKASTSQRDFQPTSCEICMDDIVDSTESIPMVCEHWFCQSCWKDYLNIKIKEGDAHNIVCPAYDCNILVPVEFIETTVSSKMARRYLQFDIKAFVASNPRLVWCPHPGCGLAVQNPERNRSASITSRTSQHSRGQQYLFLTAHCSSGHAFCWHCQMEPHDPASCDDYKKWIAKIVQMKRDEFEDVTKKSEAAANVFWMLSNSKKCPNCKSPIEKTEGCNHMRCSKCKHDFCWVCLEPWKWHNSTTGGFFRCTRYEVVEKVDEQHKSEMSSASDNHKALQELNRFVHYYTRYENHKHSLELEQPLLVQAKQKMRQMVNAQSLPQSSSFGMDSMSRLAAARFIEEAVSVLIRARHLLQFCYVYGYYLEDSNIKRMVFEFLQTELEEKTEYLSEIVARPYLRTPKAQIIKITRQVSDKTDEFFNSIANGLLPQDLPQTETKSGGKHSPQSGEGAVGRAGASASWLSDSDDSIDELLRRREVQCKAANCNKPKLQHSGMPDQHHDYCSLKCLKADYISKSKRKVKSEGKNEQIDLLQALEMSRLQLLQDMDSLTTGSSSDVSGEDESSSLRKQLGLNATELPPDPILEHVLRLSQSVYAEEEDEDLSLAIQMSMQSANVQRDMMRERSEARRQKAHSHIEDVNDGSTATGGDAEGATAATSNLETIVHGQPQQGAGGGEDVEDLYRARLVELDNAISELLDCRPFPNNESLRRTESDRRGRRRNEAASSSDRSPITHPVRRTRSERKSASRSSAKNV